MYLLKYLILFYDLVSLFFQVANPSCIEGKQYFCTLCQVKQTPEQNMIEHIHGKKHQKKKNDDPQEKETFLCQFCDTSIFGENGFLKHCNTHKHKEMVTSHMENPQKLLDNPILEHEVQLNFNFNL